MEENTNFNSEDFSPADFRETKINKVLLTLFSDSLCVIYFESLQINCMKIQTVSLVLNLFYQRFFVFYLF